MTSKGGFINPTSSGGSDNNSVDANGLRLPFLTSGGSDSLTACCYFIQWLWNNS